MEKISNKNFENKFIDLLKIYDHINPSNVIGENLIFTYYDKIKNLRPYKDPNNPNNNWKNVINHSIEALNLSKDFNISCWLLEALTYEENLYGFYLGLEIITILLEKFPNCYPETEEDKIICFEWINNNLFEWIVNEEILPTIKFQTIHNDLLNNKFNKDLVKRVPYNEEFLDNKLLLIKNINNLLEKIKIYKPFLKNLIDLLYKLDNFYKNYMKEYKLIKTNLFENQSTSDNKENIFNSINSLVLEGLKIDKNDVVLYMLYKVLLLRKKSVNEILKLIRDNELSNLLE